MTFSICRLNEDETPSTSSNEDHQEAGGDVLVELNSLFVCLFFKVNTLVSVRAC